MNQMHLTKFTMNESKLIRIKRNGYPSHTSENSSCSSNMFTLFMLHSAILVLSRTHSICPTISKGKWGDTSNSFKHKVHSFRSRVVSLRCFCELAFDLIAGLFSFIWIICKLKTSIIQLNGMIYHLMTLDIFLLVMRRVRWLSNSSLRIMSFPSQCILGSTPRALVICSKIMQASIMISALCMIHKSHFSVGANLIGNWDLHSHDEQVVMVSCSRLETLRKRHSPISKSSQNLWAACYGQHDMASYVG